MIVNRRIDVALALAEQTGGVQAGRVHTRCKEEKDRQANSSARLLDAGLRIDDFRVEDIFFWRETGKGIRWVGRHADDYISSRTVEAGGMSCSRGTAAKSQRLNRRMWKTTDTRQHIAICPRRVCEGVIDVAFLYRSCSRQVSQ